MTVSDQALENGESRKNRFSFYRPEEVNLAASKERNNNHHSTKIEQPAAPTPPSDRFKFYNAHGTSEHAHRFPDPIEISRSPSHSVTLEGPLDATRTVLAPEHPAMTPDEVNPRSPDNTEILRSLQETEDILNMPKQRSNERGPRISSNPTSNPYEDAIRDALDRLRAKDLSGDVVLRSRHSDVAAPVVDRNWENKMEEYMLKLKTQEQRPIIGASTVSTKTTLVAPMPTRIYRTGTDQLLQATSREASPDITRPLSRTMSAEHSVLSAVAQEEMQKGVERVLLAILERAKDDTNSDLANVLDDLLSVDSCSLRSQEFQREAPPSRRISQAQSDDDMSQKRSVVDDLLAEDELEIKSKETLRLPPSKISEAHLSQENAFSQRSLSKLTVDDDDSSPPAPYLQDSDEGLENVLGPMAVLGPLSKRAGGTTGVVLDLEPSPTCHGDDDVLSDTASSIIDSISLAVKEAETFVAYIASTVSQEGSKFESNSVTVAKKDKYTTEAEENEAEGEGGNDSNDSGLDHEANELMRSLCAHLLPYGVDKSTKHLSEIPPWDDSNPNEPGYRIIRLSKQQLKRVEAQFEFMVNGFKRESEKHFDGKKKMQFDVLADWNGVSDPNFERDLEEAEQLLDREEKRHEAVIKVTSLSQHSSGDSSDSTSKSGFSEGSVDQAESEGDEAVLNCHPDFPGVKTAGKGEMGDLEYFFLPIIYKSHVTGFEPTKDLHLEPGNVVAGQYLVENELGSAAFSTAYRCIDLNSDATGAGDYHEEVCLKVIKNTKDFFDQSLDEIKILELLRQTGKCQEKFIVEMKTFFYHREHLVIVTELLRQNLFEFGKFIIENDEEPYFTLKRLCYITKQCLLALEFVHSLGLVHSDIKPENILLSSYSRAMIKIIDFGSSCYLTDRQSSYIQSRSYRAPEVILGLPYNGKIDMWSLGCVVCEMFTGEVTFQNDSIVSMLSRIEAICGAFPRHMIAQGRQSGRFFTKSGLLYELVDNEEKKSSPILDDDEHGLFDVFQPKRTTMAARLGFDPDEAEQLPGPHLYEQALFVNFCKAMLIIDPDSRLSASEALEHPWILWGENLTEVDIKYPSA